MGHSVHVEIRGQLYGVRSLLPPLSEFLGSNSGQTCKASAFSPPSLLTAPHCLNVLITVLEILMQSQPVANSNRVLLSFTIKELTRPVSTFMSFKKTASDSLRFFFPLKRIQLYTHVLAGGFLMFLLITAAKPCFI